MGGGKPSSDNFITIDVTASYPQKELILQDFMDIEYIPLETNDEFTCQGIVLAVGKNTILAINHNRDGNIFVFDRNGKALRKINRMGNGSEEYLTISGITLDEDNGEMFINDYSSRRIMVYDLHGAFKRSFWWAGSAVFTNVYNFDKENLICYDASFNIDGITEKSSFLIVSKQDGSIINDIQIYINKYKKIPGLMTSGGRVFIITDSPTIMPYNDSWILTEHSTDTVFKFLPDNSITPFIVRTPSIQSNREKEVFLYLNIITDRYLFMHTTLSEINSAGRKQLTRAANLVYDKQENKIYECIVYNNDFSIKTPFVTSYTFPVTFYNIAVNNEIVFWKRLEAAELLEAREKGILNGKLKEAAVKLEKESNPVIMLVKHKI